MWNCLSKYRAQNKAESSCLTALKKCSEFSSSQEILTSLCNVWKMGYQLIGIENRSGTIFAVVMLTNTKQSADLTKDVHSLYLLKLPELNTAHWYGMLSLQYHTNCSVEIIDWYARPTNNGYGNILLKHALTYLRNSGFQYVFGTICPTDYDHLAMLQHLYQKYGFQIKECKTGYSLRLDLVERINPPVYIKHENCPHLICCRDPMHDELRLSQEIESQSQMTAGTEKEERK